MDRVKGSVGDTAGATWGGQVILRRWVGFATVLPQKEGDSQTGAIPRARRPSTAPYTPRSHLSISDLHSSSAGRTAGSAGVGSAMLFGHGDAGEPCAALGFLFF